MYILCNGHGDALYAMEQSIGLGSGLEFTIHIVLHELRVSGKCNLFHLWLNLHQYHALRWGLFLKLVCTTGGYIAKLSTLQLQIGGMRCLQLATYLSTVLGGSLSSKVFGALTLSAHVLRDVCDEEPLRSLPDAEIINGQILYQLVVMQ